MRGSVKATIIGTISIVIVALLWSHTNGPRGEGEENQAIANFLNGRCDLPFRTFAQRDRTSIAPFEQISQRFVGSGVTSRIYPVLREEEAHIIAVLEDAFVWNSNDVLFQVWRRDNGNVTFQPVSQTGAHLMDGITLDECGRLIGDNFPARQKHVGR